MENRIPIDELFHDKLFQGKEQMNLGAWANMERMLDGKNPYAEEEKKRRGLFPFWMMLLVAGGIVGAGYLIKTGNKEVAVAKQTTSQTLQSAGADHSNPVSAGNSQSQSAVPEVALSVQPSTIANPANTSPERNTHKTDTYPVSSSFSNTRNNRNNHPKQSIAALSGNSNETNTASTNNTYTQSGTTTADIASSKPSRRKHQPKSSASSNAVSGVMNQLKGFKGNQLQTESEQEAPSNLSASIAGNTSTTTFKKVETMPMVTINQKTIRNRDGSAQKVIGDTVDKSVIEKVTEQKVEEKAIASISLMVSNPRFKKLTQEEEQNARLQKTIEPKRDNEVVLASAAAVSKATSEISIAASQKASAVKHTGYFEDLRKFAVDAYRKVSNFIMFSPKPDTYTGLNMGVNASLSNSKHNFGGFQAGFTSLTPINDYVSFLAEFKFFYRNNGGYTANDISYKILDPVKDSVSMAHVQQTAYSYQKDSSVKTFNFKNFYSIELPLMMQLNYRSFALYGGVNLAYSFKLKTTEKSRNYVMNHNDTVLSSTAYAFPIDKPSQYQRSDFSGRFGLGYTVGTSYSFSPQLYLDLRISQNVWDNMRTLTAREISNGFFKVPSVQFSLGYRFRRFTPDNKSFVSLGFATLKAVSSEAAFFD